MDPLSITTAAITIAGALRGTAKAVKVARVAYLAEEGLQQITSEAGDITSLLESMTTVLRTSPTRCVPSICLEKFEILLRSTTALLGRLNDTLQGCLRSAANGSQEVHVSKRAWLKKQSVISKLLSQIKESRANLVAHWNIVLASIATEANTSTEDIRFISTTMQWDLENLKRTVASGFDEHNAVLRDFLSTLPPMFATRTNAPASPLLPVSRTRTQISNMSTVTTLNDGSASIIVPNQESRLIRVRLPQYGRRKCLAGCRCDCYVHRQQRLFPRAVESVVGVMFMSYIGIPSVMGGHARQCHRCTESTVVLTYHFPEWFIAKVIAVKLSSLTTGICASLSMSRVVPASAEVIQCACEGNVDNMASLFSRGLASPADRSNMNGTSPLTFAIRYDKLEVCQLLLFHGADPMAAEGVVRPIDEAWEKILSGKDAGDRFRQLLGSNDDYLDTKAFTFLHKVILGILPIDLENLLLASCADIDQQDADGKTPLAWAALRCDHRSLAILLAHHADATTRCKLGRTVLHYACRGGSVECINLLLCRPDVDVNATDHNGNTALHFASQFPPQESSRICSFLLQFGADVNHRDQNGWNSTFWATERDDAVNLRQLILSGAYIEHTLRSGHTPLTLAINRNSVNCLQELLDHGADVCATMENGWGIMHVAAYFGTAECIRVLKEAKCVGVDAERVDKVGKKAKTYLMQREDLCEELVVAFQALVASLRPDACSAEVDKVDLG